MHTLQHLADLEARCGGISATAALLGVSYTGTYARWKSTGKIPTAAQHSIEAHGLLSKAILDQLLRERGIRD